MSLLVHQSRIKNSFPEESVPPAEALFVVFGAEARFDNHN
jgi:hypothetical protein